MTIIKPLATCLVALSIAISQLAHADYVAYSIDKKKGKRPLPESLDTVKDKYLTNVTWGVYNNHKALIGVLEVEDIPSTVATAAPQTDSENTQNEADPETQPAPAQIAPPQPPLELVRIMLEDTLRRSNRFRVLERSALDKTIREQDLGKTGRADESSFAKVGKLLGAEYLVRTIVTRYEPYDKSNNVGMRGIFLKSKESATALNLRLIHVETGEIIFSRQIDAQLAISKVSLTDFANKKGADVESSVSEYSSSPIGQAVTVAVNKAVFELVKHVGAQSVAGTIIKSDGQKLYTDLGKTYVNVGDELVLLSKGEKIINPITGEVLGTDTTEVGRAKIISVKDKFSVAELNGTQNVKVKIGDPVETLSGSSKLQFASGME